MDRFAPTSLRRPADLAALPVPESNPVLAAKIAAEIRAAGPMTFARFMDLALYDPDGGYYTADRARPGRAGDFITAPEAHPIFGWSVARQVHQLWELLGKPGRFVLREHGAGTGALAAAILDGLAREASAALGALRYQPVEIEPRRIAALAARLAAAGYADRLDLAGAQDPGPVTGLILANEVLDALPVHRVRGLAEGAIEELFVVEAATARGRRRAANAGPAADAGVAFEGLAGPPSTPALAARLAGAGIVLRPGQEAEICLALDGWVAGRARELGRGLLVLVDYGHPAAQLYDGLKRPRGTLVAYRHHRAVDDPFAAVGRQDLTAHVDVTAVQHAAEAAGLVTMGMTTQAELLTSLGAGELFAALGQDPGAAPEDYLTARSALLRMLDPGAMGKFRAMLFGRGLASEARLQALEFRLPGR